MDQQFEVHNLCSIGKLHFTNKYPFHLVVNSITNSSKRKLWDKDIKEMKTLKRFTEDSSIIYTQYDKLSAFGWWDFVEKRLCFNTENEDDERIFISYTCSKGKY